jgi:hypothetical protein
MSQIYKRGGIYGLIQIGTAASSQNNLSSGTLEVYKRYNSRRTHIVHGGSVLIAQEGQRCHLECGIS